MQPSTLAKRGSVLLFLAVIAFYLYGLGHLPLVGPDEPRYAQVAREMFLRRDLISPTLGGNLWFEKPALLYWMMIASFKLFGVSEWSARLPAAIAGILTVVAVFCIGTRAERVNSEDPQRNYAFWCALVAATSLGVVVFSRAASFDIILTMTTAWSLAFFIIYEFGAPTKLRRRLLVGFYAFIGISLLAKGLVGIVLPLGVVGVYYVFRRRLPARNTFLSLFWGMPLALAVAATWYAPVIWRHGWPFIDQFFIQHHFARYVSNKYRHPAPFYYYLLILVLLTLPWTAFLIDGVSRVRSWRWRADDPVGEPVDKLLLFALAWLLMPLLFFSFSSSKLPGYILPVLPAAALIAGERLSRLNSSVGSSKWAVRTTALACLLFAVTLPILAARSGQLSLGCALLGAALPAVAGSFGLIWAKRGSVSAIMIGGAVFGTVIIILSCGGENLAERESTKRLLQLADARGYARAPIYGLQRDDRTPEFYAAGRVVYGPDGEAVLYAGLGPLVLESRRRQETILAMVPLSDVNQLTQVSSARVAVIGSNGRIALVAVDPR